MSGPAAAAALGLIACALGCGSRSREAAMMPETPGSARGAIERSLEDWVAAYNRKDLPGVMAPWSREFRGWFQGAPEFGYADAEQGYAAGFGDTGVSRTYGLTVHEVRPSGDIAYTRVTFHQTETRSGQVARTDIRTMQVWRREPDGVWRIVRTVSFPEPVP